MDTDTVTRLSLSRRNGEAVVVDGPACVRVLVSKRGRVRILVEAPESTRVRREELDEREGTRDAATAEDTI
jgi:carbon storage regulator CsrA